MECNPEDITPDFLKSIEQAGINRISVGIQSFHPEKLQFLGRYYDPDRYENVLETVKNSGISNFSADLIYGIPGQTVQEILQDIQKVLSAGGKHISLYALTVEKGTEYSRKVMDKISPSPEEEIQEKILKLLPDLLSPYELFQYEVSNFSKPGFFPNTTSNTGRWNIIWESDREHMGFFLREDIPILETWILIKERTFLKNIQSQISMKS